MSRVVLISDSETPLGRALIHRYLEMECQVVAARVGGPRGDHPLQESSAQLVIDWNRRSPISARNVILKILNRFQRLDEALIIEAPHLERKLLQELGFSTIERAVDEWVKGSLFLIKEVLQVYMANQQGALTLINYTDTETGGLLPPLEGALRGSFQALANSLFSSNNLKAIKLCGFQSFSTPADAFARYIVRTLSKNRSGKWFHFPPRLGPFPLQRP